jgi:hypothetical protein
MSSAASRRDWVSTSSLRTTSISAFSVRFGMAAHNGYPTLFSSRSALELVSGFAQTASWCAGLAVLPGRPAISDWRRSAPRGGSRPRLPLARLRGRGGKERIRSPDDLRADGRRDKPALKVIEETVWPWTSGNKVTRSSVCSTAHPIKATAQLTLCQYRPAFSYYISLAA